jgi:tRNA dimethylallyltransferase
MKFPPELLQKCIFLTGPTASGKSRLGIELANQLQGEVISLDSMAVYRGMDIGTAKPSKDELSQAPHHLIDVVDPHQDFTVAEYLQLSHTACLEILARDHVPIFVGGTGLYLRALLRGFFAGPDADWEFRHKLEAEEKESGPEELHRRLQLIDPASAKRLHVNDVRRVIRALEIHHLTGQPASELYDEGPLPEEQRPKNVFWLNPDRDWLYDRINRRVNIMIEQGLETELRKLLALESPIGRTARQGLGYREMIDWIEGRTSTLEEAIEIIQTRSRQFAKRQYTWFRNMEECQSLIYQSDAEQSKLLSDLLERIRNE